MEDEQKQTLRKVRSKALSIKEIINFYLEKDDELVTDTLYEVRNLIDDMEGLVTKEMDILV